MLYVLASGGDLLDPTHPTTTSLKTGLWALGIFVLVLILLRRMAWGPITEALNARERRIAASLEKAQEIERATRELATSNRRMLDDAQREAQGILAAARQSAKTTADEIIAKAQVEIEAQRDRSKRELVLEAEKARSELRSDAVDLTLLAAAKLIGKSLTSDDQRRLAEEALTDAESVARN